jgi:hypothetical protein
MQCPRALGGGGSIKSALNDGQKLVTSALNHHKWRYLIFQYQPLQKFHRFKCTHRRE